MIFIAGGTGFIGDHLLKALKEAGQKARFLVHSARSAELCKSMGFECVRGDITERDTLRGAMNGARMAANFVGIIKERGRQTFRRVHVEGTRNLLEEAASAGVGHFFHMSALGASADSFAVYHRTKAQAEELVKASGIPYTIFRPSLVVGDGGFVSKLRDLIFLGPVVPVPGSGESKFQPIYVGDLVKCFLWIIDNPQAAGKVYELGGPEHLTYNEMVLAVAEAMGKRKPLVHLPLGLVGLAIKALEKTPFRPATSEQLKLLSLDNVCDREGVKKNFGFDPLPFSEALRLFISPRARGS